MIIPVRCFTCGNVIADKWTPFVKLVMEKKNESTENVDSELDIQYINITEDGSIQKSIEGDCHLDILSKIRFNDNCKKSGKWKYSRDIVSDKSDIFISNECTRNAILKY